MSIRTDETGAIPGKHVDDTNGMLTENVQARTIVEMAGVLMVALDADAKVTMINPAGADLLGRNRDEIVGSDWIETCVPATDRNEIRRVFDAIVAGQLETYAAVEGAVVTAEGAERVLFWENRTIQDESGRIIGTLSCGVDITDRKAAQEAVRESEQRFRTMFAACPDAIFVERPDGEILDVNEAACRLQGVDRRELIGSNVRTLVPATHRESALYDLQRLVDGRVDMLESYSWSVDGEAIPVEIRARRITYDCENAILLSVRDVSERRIAERTRKRLLERARFILDLVPDAILTLDASDRINSVNSGAVKMFGFQPSELEGRPIDELLSSTHFVSRDRERRAAPMADADAGPASIREMTVRNRSGSLIPVEVAFRVMDDLAGDHRLVIIRDISARRELERDILRISEDERQRIGQDIHDHLASKFSGLAMMLRGLLSRIQHDPDYTVEPDMIETVIDQARKGAEMARTLSRGLNPVKLEERGLEAALQELSHQVETMSEIQCDVTVDASVPDLEPATASQLYRIGHEAVTNAMKHADASRITVSVQSSEDTLILTVRDDGRGMTPDSSDVDGMGIHIMKYRAGIIHGSILIDSAPNQGTAVICRVPI